MPELTFDEFIRVERKRVEELYQSSGAARWFVPFEDFARTAWQGTWKTAAAGLTKRPEIPQLLSALHSEDLALALGCVRGDERAWDAFCSEYRAVLYEAAYSFVQDGASARELADSLLAELYGLDASAPGRKSRFAYFHGRSSLKTWLRSVLYQKFVDECRRQSRLAPLPEDAANPVATEGSVSEQDDRRYAECLDEAVEAALGSLPAPEKLLLSYYYVQELTLKQIGKLRREHEATISRHLETLRKKLRKRIETHLRDVRKLSAFEVDRCLDFASRGVTIQLEKALKPE